MGVLQEFVLFCEHDCSYLADLPMHNTSMISTHAKRDGATPSINKRDKYATHVFAVADDSLATIKSWLGFR